MSNFKSGRIKSFSTFFMIILISMIMITRRNIYAQKYQSTVVHPSWSYNQTIYEVNLRQFSKSGTIKDFEKQLPEIKKLGVGIIWFMPLTPIGLKNRKGRLGSYYSVRDYMSMNPEFGTMKQFKDLVTKIHKMGMYVIIDWVADHTAWDNPLTLQHPNWFKKDSTGNFVSPVKGWSDVIGLDYSKPGLRRYMINAMKYWVEECNIDGFRCDVADMVPVDFWDEARTALDKIKPVFMLAEAENPKLQEKAFDMSYSWKLLALMNNIAKGKKNAVNMVKYFKWEDSTFPGNDFRMRFTTNHDENSWNGTVFERLGKAAATFGAFTVAIPGMPLLYDGQEAGLNKRLDFFDRDPIVWKKSKFREFYTKLFNLKMNNPALRNGNEGAKMIMVSSPTDKSVFSFIREKDNAKIFVVFNLSAKPVKRVLKSNVIAGNYFDLFTGKKITLTDSKEFDLKPWGFKFFVKQ